MGLSPQNRIALIDHNIKMASLCLKQMEGVSSKRNSYWAFLETGYKYVICALNEMNDYVQAINVPEYTLDEMIQCVQNAKKFRVEVLSVKEQLDKYNCSSYLYE